ncbi:multi-component transcriptional regulator [Calothrix parasitica NIES-267]|uniref:Multi-component transcriptional regulator n=1 Tax=Calothrix parasitica NIES-267 TaxID=1973488 RepID=A0A1Z4LSW7_9CYAN|nr:multi-component transcriptional regulator [Calothrix parasitica NIES-267]
MRILLLEDDEILSDMLVKSLTHQHYIVDAVHDGESGWEYARNGNYELLIMDVGLPLLDGITLCERLRKQGCSTPILLMTAKNAIADRISGLDAGADDYLSKPLDLGEFQARVRALLRRGEVAPTAILSVGQLSLDTGTAQVAYGNQQLKLTPKEYNLLELFLRNPSRVYSRTQIVDHLWNFDDPPLEESVKAHIKGLRQKLKKVGAVDWIENVYGLGYRLNPEIGAKSQPQVTGSVTQQYSDAVEKMWLQYQDAMIQRMTVLQTAATAFQAGKLTEELQKSASKEAHKLAGVLGMFGRDTGTQLAREIEELLTQDIENILSRSKLPSLVQELDELLALSVGDGESTKDTARLLIIDSNLQLVTELQQFASTQGMNWYGVKNIQLAENWLQNHSPDLIVLSIDEQIKSEDLAFINNYSSRTPTIPVIVIAEFDKLDYRVKVAQNGGCGFLARPTVTQIWDLSQQLLERHRNFTTKILVVDDDPIFISTLRPLLKPWGIKFTSLENSQRFWEVLESVEPDLLILDVEMPEISGIELCQAVRTEQKWQSLPILFLTSHRDEETIEKVFAAGADDYLTKPVVGAELLTRINNRLERNRLLKTISTKDSQTGINNYIESKKQLDSLLTQSKNQNQENNHQENNPPVCLAILAVAEFKKINFNYGHNIGYQVLRKWGSLIQKVFRSREVLGYWGNGEFIIGMAGLNKTQAKERLTEILAILRQQIFTTSDEKRFQVTCNCTIAEYPSDGKTIHSLYQSSIFNLQ